ncbi:hypothetical protein [Pelosinus sp. IPA-1]|uniref:hypothetical protein n=1 Tax=Pelosinus sp. IPA-1 TaxID=3029569 RepID=UPI0024362868|nr:hypothetical protein [Pelosinus sp. IPA-1]GMB00431.1 hypothetical protein PIPA1_32300 [Pelosinus sp. IPA-1]
MDIQILRFSVRHNGEVFGTGSTLYDMDDEVARKLVEESNGDIVKLPPRPATPVQPPVQDPPKDPAKEDNAGKDKDDGKGKSGSKGKGDAVDSGSGETNQPDEDGAGLPLVDPNELKK